MAVPRAECYYGYDHHNYGSNAMVFKIGGIEIYFSYRTPVVFYSASAGWVARKNDWGPTTGKHIREALSGVTDYDTVDGHTFEDALEEEIESWRTSVSKKAKAEKKTAIEIAMMHIRQAYHWIDIAEKDPNLSFKNLSKMDRDYISKAFKIFTKTVNPRKPRQKPVKREVEPQPGRFGQIMI